MKKLQNKTAIITGATSGMGKAMAFLFAKEGANVIVADLNKKEIDEVVNQIEQEGGKSIGVICNVSIESDIKNLIDTCVSKFNALDILVNNAGIMDDFTPVDMVTNDLWTKVISVNLNGPFYACRIAIPIMLKQQNGIIINIASIGGLFGCRAGLAYTASKHALIGITKNIGFMYANHHIRCNAIAPGGVNTNIGKNMRPNKLGQERCVSGGVNMPRMAEPNEIAKVALFLACEDSSFLNGSVITADGGWTAY